MLRNTSQYRKLVFNKRNIANKWERGWTILKTNDTEKIGQLEKNKQKKNSPPMLQKAQFHVI